MAKELNTIHHGDCIESMHAMPAGSIDLVFADPPFNIGYEYDVYDDKMEHEHYIDWSSKWIAAVHHVLKPDGTFWLAIGDEYAAELKLESQKTGFHCRSWVIWYYTFGVNCSQKFTRSHAHLFHFVKDPSNFTFRADDLDNRVPSARELVYNDKRANPKGRLPDDTWIIRPADAGGEIDVESESFVSVEPPQDKTDTFILRPQELEESFAADEDTWYFPRVAGTFKERAGFHGCQMPEQLLGRIIRTCSNPSDAVLDPFSGSATTLAVAKKLGRKFAGFDLSQQYVEYGRERLESIHVGDRLNGSPEPVKLAPPKRNKKEEKAGAKKRATDSKDLEKAREARFGAVQLELTQLGIIEAFRLTHDGFSADRVVADPELNLSFSDACKKLSLVGDTKTWNSLLFSVRKSGRLADVETNQRTAIAWDDSDAYRFASEIALQEMIDAKLASSVDEMICDPRLAAEFDERAMQLAPGFTPLEYRWAAIGLRKAAKTARSQAEVLKAPKFSNATCVDDFKPSKLSETAGLYLISDSKSKKIYAGETLNLRARLKAKFKKSQRKVWEAIDSPLYIETIEVDAHGAGKLAWQSCLAKKHKPKLNYHELCRA